MKNKLKHLIGFALIAILTLSIINNPLSKSYLTQLTDAENIPTKQNDLYDYIVRVAKNYSIKPQDAVNDRVWKATPGYNGVEVDIKASYDNMKKMVNSMKIN